MWLLLLEEQRTQSIVAYFFGANGAILTGDALGILIFQFQFDRHLDRREQLNEQHPDPPPNPRPP